MPSFDETREHFETALPDKYETELEPESRSLVIHRRDGSPIARYHPGDSVLWTDLIIELQHAADATETSLETLGSRAVDEVVSPWLEQGFELKETTLTQAETRADEEAIPLYVASLRCEIHAVDRAVELVEWLVRRDHFLYGDEILD